MKQYAADELKNLSKEDIIALLLQSQNEISLFQEKLAEMQIQRFGRSTERMECLGQESIFNEAEAEYNEETQEPTIEEAATVRPKRPRGKLDEMLKGLPTREELHELSEADLIATFGENGWKRLPDEVYRKLEYHPSTKEVVEHHIAVYAAKQGDEIVRAPHPVDLLSHSIATPSLVAAIMNGKYTNAIYSFSE